MLEAASKCFVFCTGSESDVRHLGLHWEDNFWTIFGVELDGGKAWRSRLPGALEGGDEHGVEGTKCRERRASWEGVSGVVYVGRQESGSLRHAMVGGPVAAAEITAKPRWAVKTGPGATSGTLVLDQIRNTWGKAVAAPGGVRS